MAGERILVVDDNVDFLEATCARLEARDLEVHSADNGPDAISMARENIYDVVILDLAMPGMGGVEVLQEIKEIQPFVQAVMLTGHGTMDAALESGRCDAFRFVEKPCDIDALTRIIGHAVARKKVVQREAYLEAVHDLHGQSYSPRQILNETKRLQEEYEQ